MRQDLKERFTPAARSTSMTLRGLESLANERIEDAIARYVVEMTTIPARMLTLNLQGPIQKHRIAGKESGARPQYE